MNKPDANNSAKYEVQPEEEVTVRVKSFGVASLAKASLDGNTIAGPPFKFTASEPMDGLHIVVLECDFPPEPPAGARHELYVSGSRGGGEFLVTKMFPETRIKRADLKFFVR